MQPLVENWLAQCLVQTFFLLYALIYLFLLTIVKFCVLQFDSPTSNVDITMVTDIQNFNGQFVTVEEFQEPLNLAH